MDGRTYGDAVCILLSNPLCLRLALLERVLILELGSHDDNDNLFVVLCLVFLGNYIDTERRGDRLKMSSGVRGGLMCVVGLNRWGKRQKNKTVRFRRQRMSNYR